MFTLAPPVGCDAGTLDRRQHDQTAAVDGGRLASPAGTDAVEEPAAETPQDMFDRVAALCGASVAVLNIDTVTTG